MAQIYIAFVDTPGVFAGIIRRVIRQKYIHVAIGLDPGLEEAYSIGRRHPSIPLIAGFEREDKSRILKAFPEADYMICSLECSGEQKSYIEERLREAMKNVSDTITQWRGFPLYSGRSLSIRKIITHVLPTLHGFSRRQACAGGTSIFHLLRPEILWSMKKKRKYSKAVSES